jgi:exosortase
VNSPPNRVIARQSELLSLVFTVLPFVAAVAILGVVARPMLTWWFWEYTRPESYYSHAPLIPFMVAGMLWYRRDALSAVKKEPDFKALVLLIPSLALLIFSVKVQAMSLESISFMASIWLSIWLALGWGFVRAAWFPILFLGLMMPLPGPVLNDATLTLQMTSTDIAAKLLNALTFTNTQQGNVISLNNFVMSVDVPCSGFKTLLALFTFNAFLAAMLDGPLWKRIVLFLLCAPMALLINSVRIALIGIVGECISSDAARVFHDYSGLIMLSLGFILLFTIAKLLGCKKFAGQAIF